MNNKRKLISVMCVIAMIASMLSTMAFAAEEIADGIYDLTIKNSEFTVVPQTANKRAAERVRVSIDGKMTDIYENSVRLALSYASSANENSMAYLVEGSRSEIDTGDFPAFIGKAAYVNDGTYENGNINFNLYPRIMRNGQEYTIFVSADSLNGMTEVGSFKYYSSASGIISGKVSDNALNRDMTVNLLQKENVAASVTVSAAENTTGEFAIEVPAAGIYDLEVQVTGSLKYTIKGIAVEGVDIDLTAKTDKDYQTLSMILGDVNNDGKVNEADVSEIRKPENINKETAYAQEKRADVNNDGKVNEADVSEVRKPQNINKDTSSCTFDF